MKRLIWGLVIVLLTLVGIALLYQFREAVLLFFLSLAVSAIFRPLVARLKSSGFPRTLSILVVYIAVIGIAGVLIYFGTAAILRDIQSLTDQFALNYTHFRNSAAAGTAFEQALAARLPPIEALYQAITGEQGEDLALGIFGVASGLAGVLSKVAIILVLSMYWSIDESRFERLWLSILPAAYRVRAREIYSDIETGLGAYLRSELVQSILMALLLSLLYAWMGLPYPALLGVIAALLWLIPWLGAALSLLLPFALGMSLGLDMAVAASMVTMLVLGLMEFVVEPRLFNRRGYSSILIVLFMIALADAYGLVGILIAPPIAAAVQILFSNLLARPAAVSPADPLVKLTQLRTRLLQLRETRGESDDVVPHIDSWIVRLDGLIQKTEEKMNSEERPPAAVGGASVR